MVVCDFNRLQSSQKIRYSRTTQFAAMEENKNVAKTLCSRPGGREPGYNL